MKKQYYLLVSLLVFVLASCSYNDDDIWDGINDLKNSDLSVKIESQDVTLIYGESISMPITFTATESYTIAKPNGWIVSVVDDKTLTIESPSKENTFAEKDGVVSIIAVDNQNRTAIVQIKVKAEYKQTTVTFEDAEGSTYWASLIDDPQYGGKLLYGDFSSVDYEWNDAESNLYSTIYGGEWGKVFWNGGIAVSNYYSENLKDNSTFEQQLTVYGTAGNNDSKNCAVLFGGADLTFSDGLAKTIDHMYIAPTTYFYQVAIEGNELSAPVAENESVWVSATGYKDGVKGKTVTKYMIKNGKSLVDTWTKWDTSELGKVDKVELGIGGETDNGYGFSIPAYFAIDDIEIIYN